jgi:CheY-like chemotaxis protein
MGNPKRILIVDDEQDIRTYLSTLFEDQGYATTLARDGVEAMQQVQGSPPDLITLDISMPEKSGVKFFRDLKSDERWKKIPIVIVTGVSEDFKKFISSRQQVPAPEGFVPKPINQEEILAIVKRLLA